MNSLSQTQEPNGLEPAQWAWLQAETGARAVLGAQRLQSLWSGYGEILRLQLQGAKVPSLILKRVAPPALTQSDRSHARKLESYQVEQSWYRDWSSHCPARIPGCYATASFGSEQLLLLEDLDAAGFGLRRRQPNRAELRQCLDWLARFHAAFIGAEPTGLWPRGTYWHLATRPDELAAIQDPVLRQAAGLIDARLAACRFRTLVHGDAKPANVCFSAAGPVAMLDFQYVGGGCGVQDVAYLLDASLNQTQLVRELPELLDSYFESLRTALATQGFQHSQALEAEWRELFPLAWTDFQRFLAGWMPGWQADAFSRRMIDEVIQNLQSD